MTDHNQYERDADAWDSEQARRKVEFSITEDDPLADTRIVDSDVRFISVSLSNYNQ